MMSRRKEEGGSGDIPQGAVMRRYLPAIAIVSVLFALGSPVSADLAPSAMLTVTAPAVHPAGSPVILNLQVYNNGFNSIGYWSGGPGEYPDAQDFVATVAIRNGPQATRKEVKLANGQQHTGPEGRMRWIVPGQLMRVPAILPPMAVGSYEIDVRCEADGPRQDDVIRKVIWPAMHELKPLRIEIRDDRELADLRDNEVIAGVRSADAFSNFLAATFPSPAVKSALVEDLMSPSPITVERAMDGLWLGDPVEEADVPLVAKAIQQHLKPPDDSVDYAMMERLICSLGHNRSTTAIEAVAKAAAARTGRVHDIAVAALGKMKYPTSIARHPAPLPPEQYDQNAIHALIKLSRSMGAPERKLAFALLAEYPKSLEAAAAIRYGTTDPNPEVQEVARQSLNHITP
jgi:hypothetical protein